MAEIKSAIDTSFNGPIVVDPVTRLEGHLRIEVEVEGGRIAKAYSCGTLFRGLETILQGRDPQDAQHITQRACGVCTYTHTLASCRAVDAAVGVKIPPLAVMMRNLVLASQFVHDHMVHFYHLNALDYVDVAACLQADPVKAAKIASDRPGARKESADNLKAVQAKIKSYVESGQIGHFTNAYFLGGHPAYMLPPEVNLIATAHYLEALHMQVKAAQAQAIFGGKNPHPQFTVVGGVTNYEALKPERIKEFLAFEKQAIDFVNQVYVPDIVTIAGYYKDVAGYGGTGNLITFGEFRSDEEKLDTGFFKPGVIWNRDLKKVGPVNPDKITEEVRHSWYKGADAPHPYDGKTEPAFTDLHGDERYSWSKAPRYEDKPCETGPLAQVLVAYAGGHPQVKAEVDGVLKALGVGPEALFSALGRTAARAIETKVIANQIEGWVKAFQEQIGKEKSPKLVEKWEMPKSAMGAGFVTASRGALSHWIKIEDGKIGNYQMVVPTTWNMSPRDARGVMGPFEEALVGAPIADPKRPVEILRVIHSFDPCIACAVHVIDPESNEKHVFKVL